MATRKPKLAKDEPKPKQPLNEQINPKAKPFKEPSKTDVMYRYVCPFCTGVAFKAPYKKGMGSERCASCGREITELKAENYIQL